MEKETKKKNSNKKPVERNKKINDEVVLTKDGKENKVTTKKKTSGKNTDKIKKIDKNETSNKKTRKTTEVKSVQQNEANISVVVEKNDPISEEKNTKDVKSIKTASFKTLEVVTLILITCIVSLTMGYLVSYSIYNNQDNNKDIKNYKQIKTLLDTYDYISDNYYGEIDNDELINKAVEAMINSLQDPYSTYFDESAADNFNITLEGNYKGIGVEIYNNSEGDITVAKVFENSPADKAGIKSGDVIVSVNGVNYLDKTTAEFVEVVRDGTENSFEIVISRNNVEQTVTINKEEVTIKSVESKIYEQNSKKVGYLKITIFANNTYDQFKNALEDLEKQKIDSLIIDLRDNTGGHLTAVKNMLALFLDSSNVIYQTQSKTETKKVYSTGSRTKKYPIVLISNKSAASASEIMLASLQENYGAKVVGVSSFGKGTIQELISLPTGEQYKFTTKKWLTPKGNWINSVGVAPDYVVELNEEYYNNPSDVTDMQLQKALELLQK